MAVLRPCKYSESAVAMFIAMAGATFNLKSVNLQCRSSQSWWQAECRLPDAGCTLHKQHNAMPLHQLILAS